MSRGRAVPGDPYAFPTSAARRRNMANTKKTAPKINPALQTRLDACTSTAQRVRLLNSEGMSRGDISRALNIRYQWVRNVLITPLKSAA
jgi:hypothetical protein